MAERRSLSLTKRLSGNVNQDKLLRQLEATPGDGRVTKTSAGSREEVSEQSKAAAVAFQKRMKKREEERKARNRKAAEDGTRARP